MSRRRRAAYLLIVLLAGIPALAGALGLVAIGAAHELSAEPAAERSFVVRLWTVRSDSRESIRRLARAGALGESLADSGDAFERALSESPHLESCVDVLAVRDGGLARLQSGSDATVVVSSQTVADGSRRLESQRMSLGRISEISLRSTGDRVTLRLRCESSDLSPASADEGPTSTTISLQLETEAALPVGGVYLMAARDDAGYLVAAEVRPAP